MHCEIPAAATTLTFYRRHTAPCTGQYPRYDRETASALIQVEGQLGSAFIWQSNGTRAWTQAVAMVRMPSASVEWLKDKPIEEPTQGGDCRDRRRVPCRLRKSSREGAVRPTLSNRTVMRRMVDYCVTHACYMLDQVTFGVLHEFKRTWPNGPQSTANDIARRRSFWKFAVKCGYASKNVAQELEMPRNYSHAERLPFTDEEMEATLKTARTMKLDQGKCYFCHRSSHLVSVTDTWHSLQVSESVRGS